MPNQQHKAQKAEKHIYVTDLISNLTDFFPVGSGNVSAAHFWQVLDGGSEYHSPLIFLSTTTSRQIQTFYYYYFLLWLLLLVFLLFCCRYYTY